MQGTINKIVIVDDEIDLCQLIKETLEETGKYSVIAVSQPKEAVEIITKEDPDLILLDLVMPGKMGDEVISDLRQNDNTATIPIIMISGKGEMVYSKKKTKFQWLPNNPTARQRGYIIKDKDCERLTAAYGVEDYISKPFQSDLLMDVVGNVLRRSHKKTIKKGDRVRYHYVLRMDGAEISVSNPKEPLWHIHGTKEIFSGLGTHLRGMHVGDKKTVVIQPKDAFRFVDPYALKAASDAGGRELHVARFDLEITIFEII